MGLMFLINGLGNNALIPIAHKLSIVYNLSDASVSLPIIITFLVYSILNLPANHIIDRKGLRLSFQFGSALYMSGIFCFTLINHGFYFTVLGSILFSIGQPFIINCPAKIATYWFFDKNVIFCGIFRDHLLLHL
jgi:fucose permease